MKKPLFLFFFFLIVLSSSSQIVTGVYKGKMYVDTPKYVVDFELTLKEKQGKLFGYCYRLFIVGDNLVYNLVKVNARIKDDMLIVEDEESVSNNFPQKRTGIKTVYFFKLKDITDSAEVLPGEWSTNRWRDNNPQTGTIIVNRERNYLATQMYDRLTEKKLEKEMLFEEKPTALLTSAPVNNTAQTTTDTTQNIVNKVGTDTKPINITPNATIQNKPNTTAIEPKPSTVDTIQTTVNKIGADGKPINTKPNATVQQKPNITTIQPKPEPVVTNKPIVATPTKPITQKPAITQQPTSTGNNPVAVIPQIEKPIADISKTNEAQLHDSTIAKQTPVIIAPPPVINNPIITKRETEIIQTLAVYEDSITLSLYDNGEIDGDTVSVFLDNEKVVANVGLTATAFKKTIYFKQGQTIQLTLFAENLGTIAPNTGLLVVYSGEKRYQVFFTSTLNKSAVILLRRE